MSKTVKCTGFVFFAISMFMGGQTGAAEKNMWRGGTEPAPIEWTIAENWSTGYVPSDDDGMDVVIPDGCAHYPVLSSAIVIDGSLTVEKGAVLTLAGHDLSLGRLPTGNTKGVKIEGILDASPGGSTIRAGSGGFFNSGTVRGAPALVFGEHTKNAKIAAGNAVLSSLIIEAQIWGDVSLDESLQLSGDLKLKSGVFSVGSNTLSIGGSLFIAEKDSAPTVVFWTDKHSTVLFESPDDAVIDAGFGVDERTWSHNLEFNNLIVNKPGGVLEIKNKPVAVNGVLKVNTGSVVPVDGGEIWLGVERDRGFTKIFDVAMKIKSIFKSGDVRLNAGESDVLRIKTLITPEMTPEIVPAAIPDLVPGEVRIIHNYTGPTIPDAETLVNIAPFADITTVPYTTMARNIVDDDAKLRTVARPEKGAPAKSARFKFRFDTPQTVSRISWAVPSGGWALMADTDGNGEYDRLLRMDSEGKVENPGGVWVSRAWLHNNFEPAVKAFGIKFVDLSGGVNLYDFQILASAPETLGTASEKAADVISIETGDTVVVPEPAADQVIYKGFHVEPWMFGLPQWIKMEKDKRPPLNEFKPFRNFVEGVKKQNGNILNMWPPTAWETKGPGTYEHEVLWPSAYDRHSLSENVLKEVVQAFHKEDIKFFTMRRVTYAKKLEDFPATANRDKPAPYVSRHSREYLNGIVREQVESGVDGVGIGYDEQMWSAIKNPKNANDITRKAFEDRYGIPFPAEPADTEAFRKWIVFAYDEFAAYLAEAADTAKRINPGVYTKSPVHLTLGTLWNSRIDVGIAEDIVGHTADIDFNRAYAYLTFQSLGHYVTALSSKIGVGAGASGGVVSLHNCSWSWTADTLDKHPGFYLHFPPVYMRASSISSVIHGGRMPLYWRYNLIYFGGYDKYLQQAYSILDTMSAWGAKDAVTPKSIALLRSRASEDWWQIRQRHNPDGDPMDQIRGYVCFKNIMELLLSNGYPFDVFYLDQHAGLEEKLADYDLLVLPFPYSISEEAYEILDRLSETRPLLVFDKLGETDEWGNAHQSPLLASLINNKKAFFVGDDIPETGHHTGFRKKILAKIDELLGEHKKFYFDSYGADVEFAVLENDKKEFLLCFINWTDRPAEVDAGLLTLPENRQFEVLQRDTVETRKVKLNGREVFNAGDLKSFRVPLDQWEVKVLFVYRR